MPNQYHHTPLQDLRHIRIIHLEPAVDSAAPIRCQLNTISLDNHPEWDGDYAALSYAWDSETPSCEIECSGDSLLVTANCGAALRELRDSSESTKLWIDSICIDQTRDAVRERNAQVALMGEIYKCARKVIVWLGKNDARIKLALDLVTEIHEVSKDHTMENRRQTQRQLVEKVKEISSSKSINIWLNWGDITNSLLTTLAEVKSKSEDPFSALFDRSWFHRMWTVQEVTISLLDRVVLRCGNIQVPWPYLVLTSDALRNAKYQWGRWDEAMSLQKQLTIYLAGRRYKGVKELLDDNPGDLHNDPLAFQIFMNARRKKSSDPKDKIFALCALFKELDIPFPAPDYSRPVEDIYREAVMSCIEYDKNLYILYYAPSDRRRDGLASWVPDFSEDGFNESDPRHPQIRTRFAAQGRRSSKWSFSEDGHGLALVGKIVDTVIVRADPIPALDNIMPRANPEFKDAVPHQIHRAYTVLKSWVETSRWSDYPTGESTRDALQRTLLNGNPQSTEETVNESTFDEWYNAMILPEQDFAERILRRGGGRNLASIGPGLRESVLRQIMQTFSPEQQTILGIGTQGMRFHTLAMAFSQKKCFFFTEKSYFGTAPDPLPVSIEPGDKIAIVRGLDMPLALRPVEGGYKLLTHVYVHGIMQGEAWPEDEDELEEIVLL